MASIAPSSEVCTAPATGTIRSDWPIWLGLAALTLVVRGSQFGNPVAEMDDQLYSFIGWRLLSGELPFADWWDRKPFGLFAIFAAAHAVGGPGPLFYQVLAALATIGGAVLTHSLARHLAEPPGAIVAAGFYVVFQTAYSGSSAQSEAFHVPMMLLMALLVRDPGAPGAARRALWAMAIGGLALQVKYTVLPQCLFFGLWALAGQWRQGAGLPRLVGLAAAFATLGLLPTVAVGLFYWMAGEWQAFYFANFVSFFLREGAYPTRFYPKLWLLLLPLGVLLVCGLYAAIRFEAPRDRASYRFYGLWLIAAIATVFLPKSVYAFYLGAVAPCVALLVTPLFAGRGLLGLAPGLLSLGYMIHLIDVPGSYVRAEAERSAIAGFARAIAPHVDREGECLFVFDGPTALYRLTGSCAPSRIVYPDHLNNALETPALDVHQAGEVARILASRPGVIVTANRPVVRQNMQSHALVRAALDRSYRPLATMPLQEREITAWLRRDATR